MILDTSAIIALANREPSAPQIWSVIETADELRMSAGTWIELFLVMDARDPRLAGKIETLLTELEVEVVDVTSQHAALARQVYRDFGRGRHRAGLNFGDCFAYALAKHLNEALLFVGDDFRHTDFRHTDVRSALA